MNNIIHFSLLRVSLDILMKEDKLEFLGTIVLWSRAKVILKHLEKKYRTLKRMKIHRHSQMLILALVTHIQVPMAVLEVIDQINPIGMNMMTCKNKKA